MRKIPSILIDDRIRRRRRWSRFIVLLILALPVSPLALDLGKVSVARWGAICHYRVPDYETPALDAVHGLFSDGVGATSFRYRQVFEQGRWNSMLVIPFAVFWTAALAMLLSRC